jgi:hypothetical protein
MVKGEFIMSPQNPNENESRISVNRGKVDSINIYEVTENELESLEAATPTGILFDIGLVCLSIAVSLSVALATTTIASERTFYTFVIVVAIGYLAFGAFTVIWLITRKSVKKLTSKIRNRINPIKNTEHDPESTE